LVRKASKKTLCGRSLLGDGPHNDEMSTGGEVANALVCKTSIRGFNSLPVLQRINGVSSSAFAVIPATNPHSAKTGQHSKSFLSPRAGIVFTIR
jgi:hypothetical protein